MGLLTKRETLVQNITYMAIMAAINAIFSLLAALVPALSLFLMIVLPLSSAIVFLFCKHRYYPIYAVATIIICLVITIFDMSFTIFYVVPSILTGYLFGLFIKYKLHAIWIILITSIAQGLFTALTLPLINLIFDVNVIDTFKGLLQLTNSTNTDIIVPSFLFYLALTQMVFSYIVIHSEINKFGYEINDAPLNTTAHSLILLGITAAITPFIFLLPSGAYLLLSVSLYFMFFIVGAFIIAKNRRVLIAFGASLLAFLFLFAFLYPLAPAPFGLLLVGILPALVALISLLNNLLFNKRAKDKIISTGKEEIKND
ncbi:MAG: hypothetical protein WCS76_02795 [Bacilli bacterium]|jgi:hypothetical protein